ncbi:hypothetical protein OH492_20000 [Vibrio chagasii]|nr:hypothetical protein [Vibrio chagasii]
MYVAALALEFQRNGIVNKPSFEIDAILSLGFYDAVGFELSLHILTFTEFVLAAQIGFCHKVSSCHF